MIIYLLKIRIYGQSMEVHFMNASNLKGTRLKVIYESVKRKPV